MKRFLPFLMISVVLAFAVGGGWYLKNRSKESTGAVGVANANLDQPRPSNGNPATTPATQNPVASSNEPGASPPHAHGPTNAPVVLEEFGDFQCPPCAFLHPELKKIEKAYGPKVRIIFREFPLVPTHQHALSAARSAEAAGMQGKFWEMHAMLYENQRTWQSAFDVRPIFEEYAKAIGLDLDRYRRDLTSSTVEQRIFMDGKRAHSLNVKGTPTLFLNGREVPFESLPAETLGPLIDEELVRVQR